MRFIARIFVDIEKTKLTTTFEVGNELNITFEAKDEHMRKSKVEQ